MLFRPWQVPTENVRQTAVRVQFRLDWHQFELDSIDAAEVPFEYCRPVREFPSWRLKRHYSGALWMVRTRRHVPFESLTERACLLELDRWDQVVAVSSQPMWIRWLGSESATHAPDYFVRMHDGQSLLIDVRPLARIDDAARTQFDRTAILCERLGWQYSVYHGRSKTSEANLRFLARYREERWAIDGIEHLHFPPISSIADVAAALNDDGLGLGRCYWLMWHGLLTFDMDLPLTLATTLTHGGQP